MPATKNGNKAIRRARSEAWLLLADNGYTASMISILFGVSVRLVFDGLAAARAARQTVRAKLGTDLADIMDEYGDNPTVVEWLKSKPASRN